MRSEVDQELRKRHARSSVGKVHLPYEVSTSDPDEVDRRLDAVDFVEENTMCSCHVYYFIIIKHAYVGIPLIVLHI